MSCHQVQQQPELIRTELVIYEVNPTTWPPTQNRFDVTMKQNLNKESWYTKRADPKTILRAYTNFRNGWTVPKKG